MKRIISFLLCTVLCLSLFTACNSQENPPVTTAPETTVPEPTAPETTAPETTVPETTLPESVETTSQGTTPGAMVAPENIQPMTPGTEATGTASAGTYTWLSFTTGAAKDSTYQISIKNNSNDSFRLYGLLCDKNGTGTISGEAAAGTVALLDAKELEPNTTYYLRLNPVSNENINYTALVTESSTAAVVGGSNIDDAVPIPLETVVRIPVMLGNYVWFSFTTGNKPTTYKVTAVNETLFSDDMDGVVVDEFGTELGEIRAECDGTPRTTTLEKLQPNTTYYVRFNILKLRFEKDQDLSLIIRDVNHQVKAHKTVDSFSEAVDPQVLINDGALPGTHAHAALPLPYDYLYSGTCPAYTYQWFSFTTGENPDGVYKVVGTNKTASGDDIVFEIMDIYGKSISSLQAHESGMANTATLENLEPNSVYYISVHTNHLRKEQDQEYSLRVVSNEPVKENTLVFETPFEINETQVQFVGDQAVFVDEAKAKEVLKPVAEAILAHPNATILLAGTTATVGTQQSCLKLSQQRAEAVRDLLANAFGVPVSQMKVVGLGYEADPFERGQDVGPNGQPVETEAVKNRRVVVLDAADPIAAELLTKAR